MSRDLHFTEEGYEAPALSNEEYEQMFRRDQVVNPTPADDFSDLDLTPESAEARRKELGLTRAKLIDLAVISNTLYGDFLQYGPEALTDKTRERLARVLYAPERRAA